MKTFTSGWLRNLLLGVFFLVLSVGAKANHINGIDLGYTWVSGNTYKVTLTVYGNCGSTTFHSLDTARPVICVFDSSHYDTSITLTLSGPSVNVSNVCPRDTDSTTCTNTAYSIPGTKRFIYTGTVTLAGPRKCWRFVFTGQMGTTGAGRVATTNLTGITVIYLQDTLNNITTGNNSPSLTVIPSPYYCQNNPDNYNPGAVDPDGDSLKFSLVSALTNGGAGCTTASSTVGYTAGYSGTNPLHYVAGTFSFNTLTGQISFTPDITGTFTSVYNIREYRGGTVVGTSQREMYFLVQTCVVSAPTGTITGATQGSIVDSVHYSICAGSGAFSFNITPTEPDTSNTITITATGVPSWGTVNIVNNGTNHPGVTFSANSTTAPPGAYSFTLTYIDNNCPIAGSNTIAYYVTIASQPLAITFAKDSVCPGTTVTYSDATTGGTWSSASTAIATVGSSTGIVTGVATGSTTITYTNSSGGCYRDTVIYVVAPPSAITGTLTACVGTNTTLADATTGGTWSSGSPAVATVSATGVVTGVAPGSAIITYTATTGCYVTATVTVNTAPVAIAGATATVCVGSTITYTDATSGGTWSSSSVSVATVGASGIITGVASGTATISYAIGTCYVTKLVTVNPSPTITATSTSVCIGSTNTLTANIAGGTWASSTPADATVSATGVVTGVAAGSAIITYTIPATGCYDTTLMTVVSLPSPITGTLTVCTGLTTSLADATPGGVWASGTPARATISAAGVVTGVTAGTSVITYTVGSGCYVTSIVTVNTSPAAITGTPSICLGSNTTLADATPGGTWSSVTTTVATVSGTGVATGVAVGSSVISYTIATCASTLNVTVNNAPGAITGTLTLCSGSNTSLSDATLGGTWTSTTTGVATVSATGVVTGVSAGTSLISYAIGTCVATATVTVNTQPAAISGSLSICNLSSTSLTDATPGGTWSSVTPGVATISATGVVTGVSNGTSLISYTIGTCAATATVTVSALPNAGSITGGGVVCAGSSLSLSDAAGGGVWSSVTPAIATVSATGVVTGVANGTDSIKYTVTNSCGTAFAFTIITVNPLPAVGTISGPTAVCAGSTITLTDGTPGGTWTSGTPAVATVTATGVVTGVTSGTSTISYSVTNSCGTANATYPVSVNNPAVAGTISGPSVICEGTFAIMTETASGGVWSMSNGNATVSSSGVATGIAGGVDTLSYTVTDACGSVAATKIMTINPLPAPAPVTGPTSVCVSSSITLSNATAGGTWSATNADATVSAAGVVTGVTGGVDTIIYTLVNACGTTRDSAYITVNPLPAPGTITGSGVVCVSASITLTDPSAGGVYSATNGNATVGAATGVVTGVTAGMDTIVYTVTNVCGVATAVKYISVNPLPATGSISGPSSVCVGATISLTNSVSGGVWSSANANATISATGVVTGVTAGADVISYSLVTSCGTSVNTFSIVINPLAIPGTISGTNVVCAGSVASMTATIPGGVWGMTNSNATINAAGVMLGVTAGLDTVTYGVTNICGTVNATLPVTVNAFPNAGVISGPGTVCQGATITLTETMPGGAWSSSSGLTTIDAGGVVTGVTGGTDTISYTISNTCGTVGTWQLVNILPLPNPGTISGGSSVCVGSTLVLTDATPGGVWSSSNTAVATVAGGTVTGVSGGSATILYSLTNSCGTVSASANVTVVSFPTAGAISGPSSVCQGSAITLLDPAPGGLWLATNGNASFLAPGILSGVTVGMDTIFYQVTNICGTAQVSTVITINASPVVAAIGGPTDICVGTVATLTDATAGGSWTSGTPAVATIDMSTGLLTGASAGTTTITYSVTNAAGCLSYATLTETVHTAPVVPAITGTMSECVGGTTTLSDSLAGGTWTSADETIATAAPTTGVITGVSAGTVTITYSVSTICGTSFVTATNTVLALPVVASITGTTTACAGTANTLTDVTPGGTWSSSNTAVATVDPSTGVVTAVSAGSATIAYTVTNASGCAASASVLFTVNPLPVVAAITGTLSECIGSTQLLSDATTGGIWTSGNAPIATIDATGLLTGLSAGIAPITYAYTDATGCTGIATANDTVLATPVSAPVTGTMTVCVGSVTTLSNAIPWGVWSSSNTAVATIDPATGVVSGIAAGTATITYNITNICGSATDNATVTVLDLPVVAPITATSGTICAGASTVVSDATTGGTWSTSDTTIATVNASGLVTGYAAGTVTVSYTVTNLAGCANSATTVLNFGSSIGTSYVSPSAGTICAGHSVYLHVLTSGSGLSYQWMLNGVNIAGATDYNYTATTAGYYSVTISNGICSETLTGATIVNMTTPVIGFTSPNTLYTGSYASYQWYLNGSPIAGATSAVYHESAPGSYEVVVTDENGCSLTSAAYVVTSGTGSGVAGVNHDQDIRLYPNPATSVLMIDAPVVVNVRIMSPDGKLVITQDAARSVSVGQIADGLYIIMVYDQDGMLLKTDKFMKQN